MKKIFTAILLIIIFAGCATKEEELFKAAKTNDLEKAQNLIESGVQITVLDEEGRTALSYAAESGRSEVFYYLYQNLPLEDRMSFSQIKVENFFPYEYLENRNEICAYHPFRCLDDDPLTTWADKAGSPENCERVGFFTVGEYYTDRITIMPGFFNEKWYEKNNRVKELDVIFNQGLEEGKDTFTVGFQDIMVMQEIDLGRPVRFRSVEFHVSDVYPGSNWNDTCISEIVFYLDGQPLDVIFYMQEYISEEEAYWDRIDINAVTALKNGNINEFENLIAKGADISDAAESDPDLLIEAVRSGKLQIVKILIEAGAGVNVDKPNDSYETPILLAQYLEYKDIEEYLVGNGAEPYPYIDPAYGLYVWIWHPSGMAEQYYFSENYVIMVTNEFETEDGAYYGAWVEGTWEGLKEEYEMFCEWTYVEGELDVEEPEQNEYPYRKVSSPISETSVINWFYILWLSRHDDCTIKEINWAEMQVDWVDMVSRQNERTY
jgi:cellobiose-specific phosphotransferase system component IIA